MARIPDADVLKARSSFGETIRRLRVDRQWSQEGLAEEAGLHRNYVGGIERGERNVGIDNIVRLAAALGVPAADLFTSLEV